MGEASEASHSRIVEWRDFVNEFLDVVNAELLAVSFDDTDNRPDGTAEILQTARIFLCHPRIVTVVAGNLRAMRQSLVLEDMRVMRDPIGSLAQNRRTPRATGAASRASKSKNFWKKRCRGKTARSWRFDRRTEPFRYAPAMLGRRPLAMIFNASST